MNEFDLLGPLAYGEPLGTAVLKATAEDFQVDEVLDIPLSGDGEHLWLWVEKRGLNTEEAARRIAKAAGVPLRTVSYAGLKDRQALTRQWFSVQLPGKADPDMSGAENDTLRILKSTRHKRKLQRGAHAANGFTLRLTQLAGDKEALAQRLERRDPHLDHALARQAGDTGQRREAITVQAKQRHRLPPALAAAVVEQQALLSHRGDSRFGLRPGAGVEKANRRGQQLAMPDLAGIAGRVDLLAHADPAKALGPPIEVFKLGFHLRQALDNGRQLQA